MQGKSKAPPLWALVLDAAGNDPLRAQQMEAELSGEWFARWLAYRNETAAEQERRVSSRDAKKNNKP